MAKRRKHTRSMQNGVAFLVTFLVFLALFGGVMVWGVVEYWQQNHGDDTPDPTPSTTPTEPYTATATRRLLLITEDGGEAQGFVVLTAEPAAARVQAIAFPRETAVIVGTEQTRLFELYKSHDIPTVKAAIEPLLGEAIDNWAVLSYANVQRLVTHFGDGVIFTLPEAVSYQTADGMTVNMKSGARTLSATQVTDLLRYSGWHGGRAARAEVQAQLAAALVNQYLTVSRFDEKDTDFHAIMNLCRSDMLASQFAEARDGLLILARHNQRDIASARLADGEFVGAGDAMRFEPAAPSEK